jgi:hypothetical protein
MDNPEHHGFCAFISESVFQSILTQPNLSQHTRDAVNSSLTHSRHLKARRTTRANRLRQRLNHGRQGLAPDGALLYPAPGAGAGHGHGHDGHDGHDGHGQPAHGQPSHGQSIVPQTVLDRIAHDPHASPETRSAAQQSSAQTQADLQGRTAPGLPPPSGGAQGFAAGFDTDEGEDEPADTVDPDELLQEETNLEASDQTDVDSDQLDPNGADDASDPLGADGNGDPGVDPDVAAAFDSIQDGLDADPDAVSTDDTGSGAAAGMAIGQSVAARELKLQRNGALVRYIYNANQGKTSPGVLVRNESSGPSKDVNANTAFTSLGTLYTFLEKVYKWKPLDSGGNTLHGSVHYGTKLMNAYWDGVQMLFGDGDGTIFGNFVDFPDVVGHELTHGIISSTSGLRYSNQSGALNEHLADVFGILYTQYVKGQSAAQSDWLIGKGLIKVKPGYMRSMRDPPSGYERQPKHVNQFVNTQADNGGVHSNSGIPNYAFYLFATSVGGNAWATVGPIWFKTMTDRNLGANCGFYRFASATLYYAGLFEKETKVPYVAKVKAAWSAVGINATSS